jgi:hypothetical protein
LPSGHCTVATGPTDVKTPFTVALMACGPLPVTGTPRTASLAINDNASGTPQTVALTGTGADSSTGANIKLWRAADGLVLNTIQAPYENGPSVLPAWVRIGRASPSVVAHPIISVTIWTCPVDGKARTWNGSRTKRGLEGQPPGRSPLTLSGFASSRNARARIIANPRDEGPRSHQQLPASGAITRGSEASRPEAGGTALKRR